MIGLMGAGKTKIGGLLAKALGRPFFDSDQVIESRAGMTIPQIFETQGEGAFRALEQRVIADLLAGEQCVIATGGGAVMNPTTAEIIQKQSISIWLKADLNILVERTGRSKHRPLLLNGDPAQILKTLMDQRYPVYAKADITVVSQDLPAEVTLENVLKALAPMGIQKHT